MVVSSHGRRQPKIKPQPIGVDSGPSRIEIGVAVRTLDRLRLIEPGMFVRLVYRQSNSNDDVVDTFRIQILGMDNTWNVLRFKSMSGQSGEPDAFPLADIEDVWKPDEIPRIRVSGYMDFNAGRPYRYVSRSSTGKRSGSPGEDRKMPRVTPQVDDLNRNARRLLDFLHVCHLRHPGQIFRIGPGAETFEATGLNETTYMEAASRLVERRLAEWFAQGGGIKVESEGIRVHEDPDRLAYELPILDEDLSGDAPLRKEKPVPQERKKVFVVHGHDENAKNAVEGFLRRLKLDPVILHLQPNRGRTIMEKLEDEAQPAEYAVILLTPDDVGGKAGSTSEPRARQNVIFEHGFFVGLLGRKNVCALYKPGVEKPSDLDGVLYVEMDDSSAWQRGLAREMHHAELSFDLAAALA
jgi:hypothetical protein